MKFQLLAYKLSTLHQFVVGGILVSVGEILVVGDIILVVGRI